MLLPDIDVPRGKGRPYIYSAKLVICCSIVMVSKRLSVRGLHYLLTESEDSVSIEIKNTIPFPEGKIPTRRTFDRRLKDSYLPVGLYMLSLSKIIMMKFKIGIKRLAMDNRMFQAFGSLWHKTDQVRGIIPERLRNVDKEAGWGVSAYRHWVYGHGLDVFVTVGKIVFPVLAISRSLLIRGNSAIKSKIEIIPRARLGVISADSEYDDKQLKLELKDRGIYLHTPSKRKAKDVPKSKTYLRRKVTVEPFFERFLQSFRLRGKLDRKGIAAQNYLVLCCFLYELMIYHNLVTKKEKVMQVTYQIQLL